jgi:hypothetical protein
MLNEHFFHSYNKFDGTLKSQVGYKLFKALAQYSINSELKTLFYLVLYLYFKLN